MIAGGGLLGRGDDVVGPGVGRGRRRGRGLAPPARRDGREAVDVLVDGDVGEAGALQLRVRPGLELAHGAVRRGRRDDGGGGLGGRHDDGPRQYPRRGLLGGREDGGAVNGGEGLRGDCRRPPVGVQGGVMP